MGSPSSRLKTAEQFRPWVNSGLQYIFRPGASEAAQAVSQPAPPPQQHAGGWQQGGHSAPQFQQAPQQQVSQPQAPVQPQQAPQPTPRPQASQPSQPSQPQQQVSPPPQPAPASKVRFPEPWNSYLNKISVTNPKVVCTYMELGLDLGGQADPKRRAVLRNTLTHHLKWPAGTAAFWPTAGLVNGALQPNGSMFWKGWDLWKTPYIVCFGNESLQIILPDAESGGTTYMLEHTIIHVVPSLKELVGLLPHEQQLALEQLTSIRIA